MGHRSEEFSAANLRWPAVKARDDLSGLVIHPGTGDVMTEVVAKRQGALASWIWNALGYLDTIDRDQQKLALVFQNTSASVEPLHSEIRDLRADVASLQANLTALVSFLGVIIPPWSTKAEVLRGDDMGVLFLSAKDLGLKVDFLPQQAEDAFMHERVLSIEPPAGSIVPKGSTVTVTIETPLR